MDLSSLTAQAVAHYKRGNFAETQRHALLVLNADALPRDKAVCHQLLGLMLHRAEQFEAAVAQLKQAVDLQPDVAELRKNLAEAHTALARQLRRQSRLAEAQQHAREALRWNTDDAEASSVLGVVLQEQEQFEEARQVFEQALQVAPRNARLRLNHANLLTMLREFDAAIEEYRKALALRPDHVKTMVSAGAALLEARRTEPAIQLLERAIQLDDSNSDAHFNVANAYVATKRIESAVEHYELALKLRPDWAVARANWLRQRAELCDWREDWDEQLQKLLGETAAELDADRPGPLGASQTPGLPVPGAIMRRIACYQTQQLAKRPRMAVQFTAGDRLRIGYLSPDFRHHAIGHLTRSMFQHHDRARFEIFTYSHGPDDCSEYRHRIQSDSEHFVDVYDHDDTNIASKIVADKIDILVDIGGYAGNGRPGVLQMRPAPVAVHYLGFPGTMGGLVDYFVTDPVLTPAGSPLRDEFEESLIYLPDTYQMTDNEQPIADTNFTRQQCGLPDTGFVFAGFNNNYKIQPATFDAWMRILLAVPDSVLWLVTTQPPVVGNLKQAAQRRDVDPARLVFSDIVSKPEHLARHRLADLFLDTTVCCAHTTATDSLWAGVPLITIPGARFTERVAASLLTAANLEELIVRDLPDYEQLAIELANNSQRLERIRTDWAARRVESKLFDTAGRVRQLEKAYDAIWQRYCDGLEPTDL